MVKILAIGDFHGKFPPKLKNKIEKRDFDVVIGMGDYAGVDEIRPYINYIFKLKNRKDAKSPEEFFGKQKFKEIKRKDYFNAKSILSELNNMNKKGVFVFGNADEEWYTYPFATPIWKAKKRRKNFVNKLKNIDNITYSTKKLKGINFIGFGGYMDVDANDEARDEESLKNKERRLKKSERKLYSLINRTKKPRIFVLHYPPKGYFDKITNKNNPFHGKSAGIKFFSKAIKKYKPSLVLCGHMHEYQGKRKIGDTIIVAVGATHDGKAAIIDFDEKKNKVKEVEFLR